MRKNLGVLVFALGLLAVVWVAAVHAVSNPMVLVVCALIALVYCIGGNELRRYRQATASLQAAVDGLKETPEQLEPWLQSVDAGLRTVVRLRVAGERIALPAPALSAYLSGVLVLLGMLGTLLGMMVTLQGTGLALESASDLQAIRDSLAAPVKGLGYAFGTSIAGIATSAVLGVLTALCRRERLAAGRALDAAIAGPLNVFTRGYRDDDAWRLMREQSQLMPALVERLHTLADSLERRDAAAHTQQKTRQEAFLARSEVAYTQLAERVRSALEESVAQGAQAASRALQPVAEATMAEIAASARRLHDGVQQTAQQNLQAQVEHLQRTTVDMGERWQQALEAQQHNNANAMASLHTLFAQIGMDVSERGDRLLANASAQQQAAHQALLTAQQEAQQRAMDEMRQQAAALLEQLASAQQTAHSTVIAHDAQRMQAWQAALAEQRRALQESADAIAQQGRQHANDTIVEISKLMQTASAAPQAAASVIGEMRQALSESMLRDTAMLEERNQLLATLGTLLQTVNHASLEQKQAVDALVETSAALVEQVGTRLDARIEADANKLDAAATRAAAGAVEVASVADAFAAAVDIFAASNAQIAERLERVESTLEKTLTRSDEQLAYYVAQAREVVDLSLLAQRQIVDDLRKLDGQRSAAASAI
ncbi:MAG: hypothetical protein KUL77_02155 [Thermomonas sp.]|uniref:hypothetical protein n=1 Tax=Thermomonas sp. TaxID=1971895 RepID=UPI001ED43712|nr:hypothetical protein [Thermomonas sp.]MBV2208350.1 hypothetical protein [Thermomonas sp.]